MNSKTLSWTIIIIILVVIAGGAVWYFVLGGDSSTNGNSSTTNQAGTNAATNQLSEIPVKSTEPILLFVIDPQSGPVAGGQEVSLQGSGFIQGIKVYFGDKEAKSVTFVSSEELTVVTPDGTAGSTQIKMVNPDGLTSTNNGGYTYE